MTDATFTTRRLADQLREWAAGLYGTEAAAELLIRSAGGRLLAGPWIRSEDGAVWFDPAEIDDAAGVLSGGERRVLEIAGSLAEDRPVSLGDAVSGIGRDSLALVLAAIAHAAGSHQHTAMTFDATGRPTGTEQPLGPLYPWPDEEGGQA